MQYFHFQDPNNLQILKIVEMQQQDAHIHHHVFPDSHWKLSQNVTDFMQLYQRIQKKDFPLDFLNLNLLLVYVL